MEKEGKPHRLGTEEELFSGSQSVVEAHSKHQKEGDERKQGKEEKKVL